MRHRRFVTLARTAAALAMALAIIAAPSASVRPAAASAAEPHADDLLTIRAFSSVMTLGRDDGHSTLAVVEHVVADFPDADENHGITRSIPVEADGVDLHTDIVSVTDAQGNALPYTVADEVSALFLIIGDDDTYLHGEQTFEITYTQRDVVRDFGNTDSQELYRDINGTDWDLPIDETSVLLTLDDSLAGSLTGNIACYTGPEGDTSSDCAIKQSGTVVTSHTGHLEPFENLTVAVGFESETFVTPERPQPSLLQIVTASLPWALLAVVLALGGWVLWWRLTKWRDAPGRGTIVPQYSAPEGICALEAAEILRRRKKGFAAQLVAFAVAGVATLSENRTAPRKRRYSLTVTDPDAADRLEPMEHDLLLAVVGKLEKNRTVVLDTGNQNIGNRLSLRGRDASRSLVSEKYLELAPLTPRRVVRVPLIAASIATILLSPLSVVAIGLQLTVLAVLLTIGISIAVYFRLATPRPRLTAEGALVRDHLVGLKTYMELSEADRIRYLQSPDTALRIDFSDTHWKIALNEPLLPYAIVWGIEKKWIRVLDSDYVTAERPLWFADSDLVRISMLSSAFSTSAFATTAGASSGATWTGTAGASSVGGSLGGGFSGGGGGGGGGGW